MPLSGNSRIFDRERARLRGPVRSVSEGSTRTEYDPAGRLVSTRWLANPDSESIETRTYDDSGRLLTYTLRNGKSGLTEKVYFYDDKGRILRIVEGSGDRTSFQYDYDQDGRKIEICDFAGKPDDREEVGAVGVDLMFLDVEGNPEFGLDRTRNASRTRTIYDERDHAVDTQKFDADGQLLSRIIRKYDKKERIIDVRVIIDDPTSVFSAKQKAEMVAQSKVALDEIKAALKKAFGSMMGESGKSYTYDSQGRRAEIILHHGLGEISRTYSYNDHGDVVEERTTFTHSQLPFGVPFRLDDTGNPVPEKPQSECPPQPELPGPQVVHYTYQYDSYGNWTERTVTRSEGSKYARGRELTYY